MTHNILAIDDERPNLFMLEEYLEDEGYEITCVQSAKEGLDLLSSGQIFHAILLDRMMPEMDGIQFLEKLDKKFRHIPVIMQTAAASRDQIMEGIAAGVFYYLTKPFKRKVILSMLKTAIKDYGIYHELGHKNDQLSGYQFSFRTIDEVTNIACYLASLYPNPEDVVIGIKEMMINAVEHGNLGISYTEKTALNNEEKWEEEISKRLSLIENQGKFATIMFEKTANEIILAIEDQGEGFEWEKYIEISPERIADSHGRGIAISRKLCFDSIEYIAPSNKVICRKKICD